MKIKEFPKSDRPREKLIKKGASALYKEELLAILLRTGIKGKNVLQVANDILQKYGDAKLTDVTFQELRNMRGVGPTKATQVLAALELGKRLYKQKDEKDIFINSPEDVVKQVENIRENKKENFITLYLDARNRLIHKETISIGILNASLVHPREVFEPATKYLAAQVVIAHNHPSGDSKPSEEDLDITEKLVKAGEILGIEVADHIIVTKTGFTSLKETKLI
jgi:DNA repair protein RadC